MDAVLVIPGIVGSILVLYYSEYVLGSAIGVGAYVFGNLVLTQVEIRESKWGRGSHARAWWNGLTLFFIGWFTGAFIGSAMMVLPSMFGSMFTLSKRNSQYVQLVSLLGMVAGLWQGGVPHDQTIAVGFALGSNAFIARALYFPLREAMWTAEQKSIEADAANVALARSLANRQRFLATLSHEVRTPLNGMLGMAQLLDESGLTPAQGSLNRVVISSGRTLAGLVDDIVALIDADSELSSESVAPYSPSDVVIQTVARIEAARKERTVLIETAFDNVPECVMGDGIRVQMVLTSLLSNAIKFTDKGSIRVLVGWEDSALTLEVVDTGIGLDVEQLDRLFHAFEVVDSSLRRRWSGAGLGLALVQMWVKRMGGSVSATSKVGEGASFQVVLPAPIGTSPCNVGPGVSAEPEVAEPDPPRAAKVLVVDDNAVNLTVAVSMLRHLGCDVVEATGGLAAVDAVAETVFDLVLMDCQMPEVDGLEATRRILAAGHRLPIVALTASVTPQEQAACRAVGMVDVIAKPVGIDRLRQTLHRYAPERVVADAKRG